MHRHRRLLAVAGLALVVVASGVGVTYAAFSTTTSNASNAVTGRPDWLAPTVSATTVKKSTGYLTGFVRQGGTYHAYANAAEPVSYPAAGIASITADLSTIDTGQTAVPLTTAGGPWTVEGVSYNYRSALLTADNPLSAGAKNWSMVATDAAAPTANSVTVSPLTVTVDGTAPTATNIATTNSGTLRRPTIGDTITFTTSEQIDPESILAGWTGASTNVTVRVTQANPDTVTIRNTADTATLPLGTVNTARTDYVTATATFGPSSAATKSTMVQSGNTITVTLGTLASGTPSTAASGAPNNMAWTPSATAYDRAGIAASTTAFTQTNNANDF
jgi:hypothetical protein